MAGRRQLLSIVIQCNLQKVFEQKRSRTDGYEALLTYGKLQYESTVHARDVTAV